jgi:hypothetical protein
MAADAKSLVMGQAFGYKDALIILGGTVLGGLVAAVDTLGPINIGIGFVPVLLGGSKLFKSVGVKEFMVGLGSGIVTNGMSFLWGMLSQSIDSAVAQSFNASTVNKMTEDWTAQTLASMGVQSYGAQAVTAAGVTTVPTAPITSISDITSAEQVLFEA